MCSLCDKPKGCRSVWKVPDGWSRPGHGDQNKRAANVPVCLSQWEGQSKTAPRLNVCVWSGSGGLAMYTKRTITLPVILWIFRWPLVCTWPISYQRVPLQPVSSPLAPLYSQSHTVLEVVNCISILFYFYWWHPGSQAVISALHIQKVPCHTLWGDSVDATLFCLCSPGGVCPLKCPFHTRALWFYSIRVCFDGKIMRFLDFISPWLCS